MSRDMVLVAMSRETARQMIGWSDGLEAIRSLTDAEEAGRASLRAALDTDREELEAQIAAELYRQGVQFEGSISQRVKHAAATARAVLDLLENGGDA